MSSVRADRRVHATERAATTEYLTDAARNTKSPALEIHSQSIVSIGAGAGSENPATARPAGHISKRCPRKCPQRVVVSTWLALVFRAATSGFLMPTTIPSRARCGRVGRNTIRPP